MKLARVSARFSKSLARRRFRPSRGKIRSITQREAKGSSPCARTWLRAELLPQHRPQLGALRALCRGASDRAGALYRRRPRSRHGVSRHGPARPRPPAARAAAAPDAGPAGLRALDPAGAAGRGRRRDDRVSSSALDQRVDAPRSGATTTGQRPIFGAVHRTLSPAGHRLRA